MHISEDVTLSPLVNSCMYREDKTPVENGGLHNPVNIVSIVV